MDTLNYQDLKWAVKQLPSRIVDALKDLTEQYVIAGGFIRSVVAKELINDVDIFAINKESAEKFVDHLHPSGIFKSDNAYSFTLQGRRVQVIHRWTFDKPEAIIKHFDFTIAQAAIWLVKENWQSLCSDDFYSDLAAKRLVYTNPEDAEPGGSLLRLLKFRSRGYSPNLVSLASVVARLTKTDERDIIRTLKEVDPGSVDWEEDINVNQNDTTTD